jgi:enoyl-CoA hydratase
MTIRTKKDGDIAIVAIDRPEARNAVDPGTAEELFRAFVEFDRDEEAKVAVLTGAGGAFCAGFDLKHAAAEIGPEWFAEHDLDPSFDGWDRRGRRCPSR